MGNDGSYKLIVDAPKDIHFYSHDWFFIRMDIDPIFKHIVLWTDNPNKYICVEPIMCLPEEYPQKAFMLEHGKQLEFSVNFTVQK